MACTWPPMSLYPRSDITYWEVVMKNFEIVIHSGAQGVHVDLVCDECNDALTRYTALPGVFRIEVDEINGIISEHVCEA